MMVRETRPTSWIKAARKDFEEFPEDAKVEILRALTIAAEGQQEIDLIEARLKRLREMLKWLKKSL